MADRYEDRYRGQTYRGERGYGREDQGYGRDDRGFVERAGDEVRSWFGDEEARRRRQRDEREYGREYGRGPEAERTHGRESGRGFDEWTGNREPDYGDRGWSGERGTTSHWRDDPGRIGYESRATGWGGAGVHGTTRGYGPGIWSSEIPEQEWRESSASGFESSRQRGSYAGRGPKGYQRSDARINEDVCDRLTEAPGVDASEVEVTVRNGEVTLAGVVPDRMQKRRSEDLIENIPGVREVHNNLRAGGSQTMSPGTSPTPMGSSATPAKR